MTNWLRLFGFSFILITFAYSMEAARRRSIKAHTMDVLMSTREGGYFQSNLDTYTFYTLTLKRKDKGKPLDSNTLSTLRESQEEEDRKNGNAIVFLINYYEYLAAGIENQDLDEAILKNTLRGQFCNLIRTTQHIVKENNDKDPRTLNCIIRQYKKWEDPDLFAKTVFCEEASE